MVIPDKDKPKLADALYRTSFDAFAQSAFRIIEPAINYEWSWHVECISEHLQAIDAGEIEPRLIINLPPRSLKSYLVSTAFPAWVLGRKPHTKFICTSYGFEVVEANARKCKQIIMSDWYKALFPDTKISPMLDRITNFETTQGGQYYAASALSPITGIGADYVLCDDLLKSMEANSETIRTSTNLNIRTTLLNRFNDRRTGKFVMVMQRLHDDDPTGHLLKDGGYRLLKLPAETKERIEIDLNGKKWVMPENSLLFPERLSRETLDRIRLDMSEFNYAGQYLQEPVPLSGGDFREEWVQFYANGSIKPKDMNIVILVDPSGGDDLKKKKKKQSDWTAMVVVGFAPDNNKYILDIIRDRLNPKERVDMLFLLHRKWNELSGKSPKVGYEKYGMMTDTFYIEEKKKQDAYHFPLIELGGGVSKEERIRQLIPDLQNGRWYLPQSLIYIDGEGRRFDLVQEIIKSEMATFPRARFDDMLDAWSRIYTADLNMIFPKGKVGMATKAYKQAREDANVESWMDY
jgi:phage terminase large subunit-like protein